MIFEYAVLKTNYTGIFTVIHIPDNALTIQQLIQLVAHVNINNYLLFCDGPPPCFGPLRPSSFTKEYIYNKCCQRCFSATTHEVIKKGNIHVININFAHFFFAIF